MELELRINGVVESIEVSPGETLLTLLRREGHQSVKRGCETGECGACTVMVEGVARPACVMLAAQAGGCSLTTVEGLSSQGKLHPLQEAFIESGAAQCGYCTPGMLVSAYALLQGNARPNEDDVRDALSGHLCRCSGYEKAVQSVLRAAARMRGEKVPELTYQTINATEDQGSSRGRLLAVLAESSASASGATIQLPALKMMKSASAPMPAVSPVTPVAELASEKTLQSQFLVVGKAVPVLDAQKNVTGKASFTADNLPRNLLYARVMTSPHAHAIIREIQTSSARSLSGVHAILTHENVPRVPYSRVEQVQTTIQDRYCLDSIVRYVGDRVAVVVADTPEIAEEALKRITVVYEELPAILDPRLATDVVAPRLHPETDSRGIFDATRNIAARVRAESGDIDQGFAAADLVLESEYIVSPSQATPLENHAVITYFDENDILVVQTNCSAAYHVQRTLGTILGLPLRRIRVETARVSGGVEGRQEVDLEDICALLTIATGRPVMLTHTRGDEFATSMRSPHILRIKTGVMRDGSIVANQLALLVDTGAHGTHPLITRLNAFVSALSLYPCQHMRFVAEVLYTNHAPAQGNSSNELLGEFFALESHMDEIAAHLKMDALALRRKNWIRIGDHYPLLLGDGSRQESMQRLSTSGLSRCLHIVEEKLRWAEKRHNGNGMNGRFRRGIGMALAMQGNPGGQTATSGAMMKLNEDGSFDIFVGMSDGGNAITTQIAQIAAEVLGVPLETILIHALESTLLPAASGTGDSALYSAGGAVRRAAEQMRRQVLTVAGRMLNTLPEALRIHNGIVGIPDGQHLPIAQVAEYAFYQEGRQLMTTVSHRVASTPAVFAAQGVEVEVDTETGYVRVLNVISAIDVGRALNPQLIEGYVQACVTQSLGIALSEELYYNGKGELLTTSLADYRIFSAADMPAMQTFLVETDDSAGPFGAKSIAGVALYGVAPAIANAITDAVGVRMRQIPLTPERVLRAIHAQKTKK